MKQVRCPHCQEWSSSIEKCDHCGKPISRESRELEKTGGVRKIAKPEPPGKLQRFFEYAQQSKNPFVKLLYFIVMSLWGVYVGLVVLILYIAVAASG